MKSKSSKTNIDTSAVPEWFHVEDPERRELWTTRGKWDVDPPKRGPYRLMTTEAEAVLWATTNTIGYTWDGSPPFRSDVQKQLLEARQIGRPGVHVMTFADGKWRVLENHRV